MDIKLRKQKEREELRQKILDAAKDLFLEKGFAQTSMRNIAERISYSPTTIYLHFKDKDAIFHAIHQYGFVLMSGNRSELQEIEDPFERLKAMGWSYIRFALEHPNLYDLMFIQPAPIQALEADDNPQWMEGALTFNFLRVTVEACIEKGYFRFEDSEAASYMIWGAIHGLVALYIRQRFKVISPEKRDTIVERGYAELNKVLDQISVQK